MMRQPQPQPTQSEQAQVLGNILRATFTENDAVEVARMQNLIDQLKGVEARGGSNGGTQPHHL